MCRCNWKAVLGCSATIVSRTVWAATSALLLLSSITSGGRSFYIRAAHRPAPCDLTRTLPDVRKEAAALVAVMTGFEITYQERRAHARQTWFPASAAEVERMLKESNIEVRFAVGEVPKEYERQIAEEEEKFGAFLHIPVKDRYTALSFKVLGLWQLVSEKYNVKYVIKVDDDNFVRLDRLAVAVQQWEYFGAEYVGCFKTRDAGNEMLAQQSYRWYDPHHAVLLGDDSVYAEGAFYALRSHVIEGILLSGLLPRAGGPEDMMTGWLMKAFNVSFYDDPRLCLIESCSPSMIAFKWDHAVRDYMDPTSDLAATLCCVDEAHSLEGRNECTDPALAHAEGLRCMHKLHTDPSCAAPTLSAEYKLPIERRHQNLGSDWEWIVKTALHVEER